MLFLVIYEGSPGGGGRGGGRLLVQGGTSVVVPNCYLFLLSVFTLWLLVVLRLNVPVNNFSVMSGRSHRFLGN